MKKLSMWIACLLLSLLICGCDGSKLTAEEGGYDIYYINRNETALIQEMYTAKNENTEDLIQELLSAVRTVPENREEIALLDDKVSVIGYLYDGSNIELNMSQGYGDLKKTKEVLIRAGLVRTLAQIDGVDTVSFLVNGQPLRDSKDQVVGRLNTQSFIENSGKQINSYKSDTITLYFTNATGNILVGENRKLYYSSNVSLEQVVVEQLLKGPKTEEYFPTLPENAHVMNVTVVDKVCYVNFDDAFSSDALNVQEWVPIYSIVNSITENCNVYQVQISINGESDLTFRENMKLSEFYEMNRDLIREDAP